MEMYRALPEYDFSISLQTYYVFEVIFESLRQREPRP